MHHITEIIPCGPCERESGYRSCFLFHVGSAPLCPELSAGRMSALCD